MKSLAPSLYVCADCNKGILSKDEATVITVSASLSRLLYTVCRKAKCHRCFWVNHPNWFSHPDKSDSEQDGLIVERWGDRGYTCLVAVLPSVQSEAA